MSKFISFFALLCVLQAVIVDVAYAARYGAGWYGEIQASYGYENNIARTYLSDEVGDQVSSFSIGGGHSSSIGRNAQLVVSGYYVSNQNQGTDALSKQGISLGIDYTVQPALSYTAPWYSIRIGVTDRRYSDSRPREGLLINAELVASKRLSTELVGRLGYRHSDIVFHGKSSAEEATDDAFNVDSHELFLGVDYFVSDGVALFGEYGLRRGDILSSVSGGLRNDQEYDAITLDSVFDSQCLNGCSFAYRQQGNTQVASAGLSFPVGNVSLDVTANYFDAEGDNGRSYEDWLVKIGVLWIFF